MNNNSKNYQKQIKSDLQHVAHCADSTWTHPAHYLFQKANRELYNAEMQMQSQKVNALKPRMVKDCIPNSKLALYSNYEYNESREMSYTPNYTNDNTHFTFTRYADKENCATTEPWMLPEVDNLFAWFLFYQKKSAKVEMDEMRTKQENEFDYESPAFTARNFAENSLKLCLQSDNMKKLWEGNHGALKERPVSQTKRINIYKSPSNYYFVKQRDVQEPQKSGEIPTRYSDFKDLKALSQSFNEQSKWLLDRFAWKLPTEKQSESAAAAAAANSKLSYAAVLQGASNDPFSFDGLDNDFENAFAAGSKEDQYYTSPEEKNESFKIIPKLKLSGISSQSDFRMADLPAPPLADFMPSCAAPKKTAEVVTLSAAAAEFVASRAAADSRTSHVAATSAQNANTETTISYTYSNFINTYNNYYMCQFNGNTSNKYVFSTKSTQVLNRRLQNSRHAYPPAYNHQQYVSSYVHHHHHTLPSVCYPAALQNPPFYRAPMHNHYVPQSFWNADGKPSTQCAAVPARVTSNKSFWIANERNLDDGESKYTIIKRQHVEDEERIVISTIMEETSTIPMVKTNSSELELEALEQYNSNDSIFGELEREAAEQYEDVERKK